MSQQHSRSLAHPRSQNPAPGSSFSVMAEAALLATVAAATTALGHTASLLLGAGSAAHSSAWPGILLAWGAALALSTVMARLRRTLGERRRGLSLLIGSASLGAAQLPFHGILAMGLFSGAHAHQGEGHGSAAALTGGSPWARLQQENLLHTHSALAAPSAESLHTAALPPSMVLFHLLAWLLSAAAFAWAERLLSALLSLSSAAHRSAEAASAALVLWAQEAALALASGLGRIRGAAASLLIAAARSRQLRRRAAEAFAAALPSLFAQTRPAVAGFRGPPRSPLYRF